tara:strand:- start:1671 stop:2417 length:747 start_codon:yes stop_codon:yes gene_type:complete
MKDKEFLKKEIYKLSALTDRGQRLNKLIAPLYQEKLSDINNLIEQLKTHDDEITEEILNGEWELIFSNVELFRSSPFFLAIENALGNKLKSDLFFKLHQLQVCSFGLSTVGRISQNIDLKKRKFISTFDTIIFGLTTIPIVGWFKLFPTFGGCVTTLADDLVLEENKLKMTLQKTKVTKVDGLNKIPFFNKIFMDKWYPIRDVWVNLPWNNEKDPTCEVSIIFIDEDLRVMKDMYESIFIYVRPKKSH